MKNQSPLVSLKEKSKDYEEDKSRENVLKLILQNLVNRYSLPVIINDIISVTKHKENQLILKDKIPLTSTDIISIMYKNFGSIKLFRIILDLYPVPNNNPKFKNSEKETNYSNSPFNSRPNSSIEEENPQTSSAYCNRNK